MSCTLTPGAVSGDFACGPVSLPRAWLACRLTASGRYREKQTQNEKTSWKIRAPDWT